MSDSPDDAGVNDIITHLLRNAPDTVSYDQIEQAMVMFGHDPFEEHGVYQAILDHLDQRDVMVRELITVGLTSDTNGDVGLDDIAVAELRRVLGPLDQDTSRLLNADEERTLLEVVRDGRTALLHLDRLDATEDTTSLTRRVAAGARAEEELVRRNIRLVAHHAFLASRSASHLDAEDLIQEGVCGLLRAIRGFDFNQSQRLSTYATYWIRQAIARALADQDRTIRLPVHRVEMLGRYRAVIRNLTEETGCVPTDLELAVALHLIDPASDPAVQAALASGGLWDAALGSRYEQVFRHIRIFRSLDGFRLISLDQPAGEDGSSELGELLVDVRQCLPEDEVIYHALCDAIDDVLAQLSDRDAKVIRRRFGLNGEREATLEEIGDDYGLTRERIRQIEDRALRKFRHPVRSKYLRSYPPGTSSSPTVEQQLHPLPHRSSNATARTT